MSSGCTHLYAVSSGCTHLLLLTCVVATKTDSPGIVVRPPTRIPPAVCFLALLPPPRPILVSVVLVPNRSDGQALLLVKSFVSQHICMWSRLFSYAVSAIANTMPCP